MLVSRFSPRQRPLVASLVLGASTLFAVSAAQAQTLTDITLFRLDNSNNTINEGGNTRGASFDGSSVSNLYLLSGGSFVNNGNGDGANIAINLSVPGTYTFAFAMDNVNGNTNTPLGINFFFDNDTTSPSISARGPQDGGFVANGNLTNRPLFSAGSVAGANTLVFVGSGQQITLSDFTFQTTGGPDQVSSFNNAPDGGSDTNGTFTLTVGSAAAPEPASFALFGMGILPFMGGAHRRRRAATTTS